MTGSQITFLLNGEVQRLEGVAPATTLYQLIRERHLTGTKEGCAEGDCGACTVALGSVESGYLRLRAVNSCILLAGQLHGKSVTTVEGIKGSGGELHPVQQAMVDCHGSQCGFCTPGFVMTLFVAHAMGFRAGCPHDVTDLIAGNLCRCTGYGPIIEAARRMQSLPVPQWDLARRSAELAALAALDTTGIGGARDGRKLFLPTTVDQLTQILRYHPDATIVAGATDVGLWVTKQHRDLPAVVHIDRVRALQQISQTGDTLSIGAAVTYADLPRALLDLYPSLDELVDRIGSTQVRNCGTIGGNIANGSPIGDLAPALIALGATLVLRSQTTERRIALEDFFIAYGRQDLRRSEFVAAIEIPLDADPKDFKCYKVSKRRDQDISAVCGAFNIHIDDGIVTIARIAFGGMAATPKRAKHVEAALIGKPWTKAMVAAALPCLAADFQPIDDMRASAAYRLKVAGNLLLRFHLESGSPPLPRLSSLSA